MKLTVFERLVLAQVLSGPSGETGLTTLRIMRKLREALSFSEEEHAALNLRNGEDWSKCPKCGGTAIEFSKGKENPDRRCITCGYEGAEGVNQIFWNTAAPQEFEIEVGKKALEIVKGKLEELDKAEKLSDMHLSLCDKFGLQTEDE